MNSSEDNNLLNEVTDFWEKESCGTFVTNKKKHTFEYFEEIEEHRYRVEPEIFSFTQFTRYNGKKILEVGVGAGTDFLQFARGGAICYGIDLTKEAIENVKNRFDIYKQKYEYLAAGNSEELHFEDGTFDLVYSWGVIHHSPNMENALKEIVRVCKTGGECKIMLYNRYSMVAFYLWFRYCFLKLKFYKTLSYAVYHHMESLGTKCYTTREVKDILSKHKADKIEIENVFTYYDKKEQYLASRLFSKLMYKIFGNRIGWFKLIRFTKR